MIDDGRADWPAMLRAANAWRRARITSREWTTEWLHALVNAECAIAPSQRLTGHPIVAQAQRESANIAATIARHYRAYRAGVTSSKSAS